MDGIERGARNPGLARTLCDDLSPERLLVRVIRRPVGNDDELRARVTRCCRGASTPDVLTNDDADPNAVDVDDARIAARVEVALLVENGVIRKATLTIERRYLAVAQHRDRVVASSVRRELGKADQNGDSFDAWGEARQFVGARGKKRRTQQQILGWIATKGEFRSDQQLRSAAPTFGYGFEDTRGIAGKIADHLVELSDRDAHV